MGQAFYDIVAKGNEWTVIHDGAASGDYITAQPAATILRRKQLSKSLPPQHRMP